MITCTRSSRQFGQRRQRKRHGSSYLPTTSGSAGFSSPRRPWRRWRASISLTRRSTRRRRMSSRRCARRCPASAKAYSTMHDTYKQDYLAQAERHIAIAEDRIARQKKIIDELVQAGQETDCAVSMLHALETCLHAFEQHLEMIFERCKN